MSEVELKFQVPEDRASSLQRELLGRGGRSTRMLARYFDTSDGLLARHGLSLRLRKEGRRWVQTLKAEGDSAVRRLEHNVPLRVPAGSSPALDTSRHDGTEAGDALRKMLAHAGTPALVERFAADVSRRACSLHLSGAEVEAALDVGTLLAGERTMPIRELELELKSGDARALFVLAEAWADHGGLWLNTLSKAGRGGVLADGQLHGPPTKARTPALDDHMSGEQLVRAVLRSALDQVLANASEVASGSTAEEHIHQARVGLRRLRTALRELAPLARGIHAGWEAPLAQAFARLGELRDNETVAATVRPLLEQAGAPKIVWDIKAIESDPGATVRDATFQRTLLGVLSFALTDEPAGTPAAPHPQARDHVVNRLSKLHKQVVRGGRRFEALPPDDQHKVRKRLKRLRYLAEFVEPLWPGKAAQRYLRHLGPAQDALGLHNDIAVASAKFRADAEHDPQALFAAGYLQARLDRTAHEAHAALKEVVRAQRFWKR